MLFMQLLINRAQIFADVRTYWSPEATKRVTGYDFEGKAKENGGIIHLLNSGAPYLAEHDVVLLQNHGALTVGCDLITAYYRMETLELFAKISLTAHLLGGAKEIEKPQIDKLLDLRENYYKVTGKHPGYKHYNK